MEGVGNRQPARCLSPLIGANVARPRPPFEWIPGRGYDPGALARMAKAFPRPPFPMGEAWFMSEERRMYDFLMGDLDAVSAEQLQEPLTAILSGTSSFGPIEEWQIWHLYLLARLIPRSHESFVDALLELLVGAFITQFPEGILDEPYPGFRDDVLDTLGRCMMDAECWSDGEPEPRACFNKWYIPKLEAWRWDDADGPFSASMFFCLKYLRPEEIAPWLASVMRIASPYWRAQVMMWLLGVHGMLAGEVKQISEYEYPGCPNLTFEWSHVLNGHYTGDHSGPPKPPDFLPPEHRAAALTAVRSHFTEAVFLEWLESIAARPDLERELGDAPFWFYDLYASA